MDMAELQKMMSGMGGGASAGAPPGGDDGPGGMPPGMDMEALMAQLGGMGGGGGGMGGMGGMEGMMGGMGGGGMMGGGGPPPDMGEVDGGSGDTKWKWEMKDDEIIVRIELSKPATKKDLKVTFGATSLKVEVFGETIIDGKLEGAVHADECTWCIAEKGAELQLMLVATSGNRWVSLMDGSD